MGKPRSEMISFRQEQDLRFMFKPSKCFAVHNSIPISLIASAQRTGLFGAGSSLRIGTSRRPRGKNSFFHVLPLASDAHGLSFLLAYDRTRGVPRVLSFGFYVYTSTVAKHSCAVRSLSEYNTPRSTSLFLGTYFLAVVSASAA
jgi:hypothetical protein